MQQEVYIPGPPAIVQPDVLQSVREPAVLYGVPETPVVTLAEQVVLTPPEAPALPELPPLIECK